MTIPGTCGGMAETAINAKSLDTKYRNTYARAYVYKMQYSSIIQQLHMYGMPHKKVYVLYLNFIIVCMYGIYFLVCTYFCT